MTIGLDQAATARRQRQEKAKAARQPETPQQRKDRLAKERDSLDPPFPYAVAPFDPAVMRAPGIG